jgi:quercetin dioxygenase-like cupin family protein
MEWVLARCVTPADGPDYGPHVHQEYEETFLVLEGSLEFLLEDTVHVLGTGDFVRVPQNTRHGFANRSSGETRLLVHFLPGGMEELFLKHRTDQAEPPSMQSFLQEAAARYGSHYER